MYGDCGYMGDMMFVRGSYVIGDRHFFLINVCNCVWHSWFYVYRMEL